MGRNSFGLDAAGAGAGARLLSDVVGPLDRCWSCLDGTGKNNSWNGFYIGYATAVYG